MRFLAVQMGHGQAAQQTLWRLRNLADFCTLIIPPCFPPPPTPNKLSLPRNIIYYSIHQFRPSHTLPWVPDCSSTSVTTRVTSFLRISLSKSWIDVTTSVYISPILVRPLFQCADPRLQTPSFQLLYIRLKTHHPLPTFFTEMGRRSVESARPIMAPSVSQLSLPVRTPVPLNSHPRQKKKTQIFHVLSSSTMHIS